MTISNTRWIFIKAANAALHERFPKCFKEIAPIPLKVGIWDDIVSRCPDIPVKILRTTIAIYVDKIRYQYALTANANRVDLDGNVAGQVSEEQAEVAAKRARKLRRIFYKKKAKEVAAAQEAAE